LIAWKASTERRLDIATCKHLAQHRPARRTASDHVRSLRAKYATTILSTTHDMEAGELADRVGIRHHGRLEKNGTPKEQVSQVRPRATLEDVFSRVSGGGR
jgi:ABC-2 type transport system ATP-binding protein